MCLFLVMPAIQFFVEMHRCKRNQADSVLISPDFQLNPRNPVFSNSLPVDSVDPSTSTKATSYNINIRAGDAGVASCQCRAPQVLLAACALGGRWSEAKAGRGFGFEALSRMFECTLLLSAMRRWSFLV